jgi:HEAT repeats
MSEPAPEPAATAAPGDGPGFDQIDAALGAWLRDEDERAWQLVVGHGPAALRRAVSLYYGPSRSEVVAAAQRSRPDRELVDAWAVLFGRLAEAFPTGYLAELAAGRIRLGDWPTLEVVILGSLPGPDAVAALLPYGAHTDWLVRYHVVRGLGWRTDPAAVDAVAAAVSDPHQSVRDEAARWVQRRSPRAAVALYQELLADPAQPAQRQEELRTRLATARRVVTQLDRDNPVHRPASD